MDYDTMRILEDIAVHDLRAIEPVVEDIIQNAIKTGMKEGLRRYATMVFKNGLGRIGSPERIAYQVFAEIDALPVAEIEKIIKENTHDSEHSGSSATTTGENQPEPDQGIHN
jgi:hypothetical protein